MRATLWAVPAVLLCASAAMQASVTLTFSGTYDTRGTTVFGLTGSAVPFSYQITYDPALDTNSVFVPAGSTVDGRTVLNDWYGYSASGITALNVTFGTKSWTTGELVPLVNSPGTGLVADMYFDADISTSTPTRSDIYFLDPSGSDLSLGSNDLNFSTIEMGNLSMTDDGVSSGFAVSLLTITSSVPEPGTTVVAAFAAAGLLSSRRRNRRGPRENAISS